MDTATATIEVQRHYEDPVVRYQGLSPSRAAWILNDLFATGKFESVTARSEETGQILWRAGH